MDRRPSNPSYERYKKLADQVELAIMAESARWGDQSNATPYTVADWRKMRDYILGTYMPQRPAIVLSQLKNAGLYPATGCAGLHGQRRSTAGRQRPVEQPIRR